eukprot:TRINITY_DN1443_c0_g1_i1.p1 TRINITY_DN1443_c0_g1~~TRINITY_DN1443_c0_g1_i1.p1  ORF type:complete len:394 (+),score=58.92 TRINITY_DN1443_c0_g1_i1:284-1465(+)
MPLGQRPGDNSEARYCGAEVAFSDDIQNALAFALAGSFDFLVSPLTNPDYRPSKLKDGTPPFAGSDLVLSPSQWSSHIVGKISTWIDLDAKDELARLDGETTLKQELGWASHLSLQACLLPTPRVLNCANYARCVNQTLQGLSNMQLWVRIPLVSPELQNAEGTPEEDAVFLKRDSITGRPVSDSWEWWNMFRSLCEHHSQLSVALDITASLPSPSSLRRWIGEPLKAAILHTSAFLTNKRGYPCLSKRHQNFITALFNHNVQVIISGEPHHNVNGSEISATSETSSNGWDDGSTTENPLRPYLEYVAHLYRRVEAPSEQERFEIGYRDFLQAPLQPLMDNLEAQTYETFEKDATKYQQYQKAVHAALLDRIPEKDASSITLVRMGAAATFVQ